MKAGEGVLSLSSPVTYLLSKEIPSLVRLFGVAPKSKDLGMRTRLIPGSAADHQWGLDSVSSPTRRIALNYLQHLFSSVM